MKPIPASEQYPELNDIATKITSTVTWHINQERMGVKTDCPYPAQCILELVISKLEKLV